MSAPASTAKRSAAPAAPAARKPVAPAKKKSSKAIFNAREVVACLWPLKQAAASQAKGYRWYAPVLKFKMNEPRKGNNGTTWFPNSLKIGDVEGPIILRVADEIHVGQIMPDNDAEIAQLMAANKNKNRAFKKREKGVSIQVNKWAPKRLDEDAKARGERQWIYGKIALEEDGVTLKKDENKQPILPDDRYASVLFKALWLLDDAFKIEMQSLLDSKRIITREEANAMEEEATSRGETFTLPPGTQIVTNKKIASRIQTRISGDAAKNAGKLLPNPIARVDLKFDKDTGEAAPKFYDRTKHYIDRDTGKKQYEGAKVDGQPITAGNVHKFMVSGSSIDGLIYADAVCFSNMGISIPVKADICVVEQGKRDETTVDDVYEDDGAGSSNPSAEESVEDVTQHDNGAEDNVDGGDDTVGDDEVAETSSSSSPTATSAPEAKPVADDNFDDLLEEIKDMPTPSAKPATTKAAAGKPSAGKPSAKPSPAKTD
jgi:hypothetical protein